MSVCVCRLFMSHSLNESHVMLGATPYSFLISLQAQIKLALPHNSHFKERLRSLTLKILLALH